jgi:hypothetical protein
VCVNQVERGCAWHQGIDALLGESGGTGGRNDVETKLSLKGLQMAEKADKLCRSGSTARMCIVGWSNHGQ